MEFNLSSYLFLGSVPIIVGLVAAIRKTGLKSKFAPAISIVLGIALNVIIGAYLGNDLVPLFVQGIIAGLSASGLWSGTKATVKK